ncbi:TonB-dependent siderophore receptor [Xanthomonas hyacinthi]|uniref:TonB-dependent siderophore receptor n=1 Tax=Xanthomonas hyacinthi TaxID=56455 RepID=UPI003610FE54
MRPIAGAARPVCGHVAVADRGMAGGWPFALILLLPIAAQAAVRAQDATGQAAEQATELDAVQVHAEPKRNLTRALGERTLLDTPFSIANADSALLEERQVAGLGQAFFGTASISPVGNSYGMWASLLEVRGLALDWSNSYKINGMPFYAFGVEQPLEAFEQVQLLKGASGFMYGFGAPGGIVNYVTKQPTDTRLLSVDMGYRSDSLFSAHVDAGGRFGDGDRFGYRLNASSERGDTYFGSRLDRQALAGAFAARLSETLTLSAELIYQRRYIQRPMPYIAVSYLRGAKLLRGAIDGDTGLAADAAFGNTRSAYAASGLRWQFAPDWQLRVDYSALRTGQRFNQEYFYLSDQDGDYVDNTFTGHNLNRFDVVQALLQGRFATGSWEHQLVAGLSWQQQQVWAARSSNWIASGTGNLYRPQRLQWTPADSDGVYRSSDYLQRAAFVSDTIAFTPRWSVLLGLRYTDYLQRSFDSDGTRSSRYAQSSATPTAALLFKPRADSTLYASYVESLEQGNVVGSNYANHDAVLPPLKSKQLELGGKIERDAWSAAAAAFRVQRGATYVTADNTFVQDGEIRYRGLELEGQLHPTEGWTVAASALLMDADYARSSAALAGKRPGGFARRAATLSLEHTLARLPALSLHVDLRATGPKRLLPGSPLVAPGYLLSNLGASYRTSWRLHPLTLRAEIDNLFDRRYWMGSSYTIQPGASRTLALNAKLDF